jgi:hypothetical protein
MELSVHLPEKIRELGIEDYVKRSSLCREAKSGEKKALILLPLFSPSGKLVDEYVGQYLKGVRVKSSLNLVSQIKRFDKVFVVIVESEIASDGKKRKCILGIPFLKVKVSLAGSEIGSRNVVIRKREKSDSSRGSSIAKLKVVDFTIRALYAKDPKVLEEDNKKRVLELDKYISLAVLLRRKVGEEVIGEDKHYKSSLDCKIGDIEIKEDGSFSTKLTS